MEDFVFYIRSLIETHCENFENIFRKKDLSKFTLV